MNKCLKIWPAPSTRGLLGDPTGPANVLGIGAAGLGTMEIRAFRFS